VIHILVAGLWLSSVIVLALLPILALRLESGDEIYMYNLIYHFIDIYILTPAAVFTLGTGLIYSIFTRWGFFRHGWLIYKWVATLSIIVIGTFYLGPMVGQLLSIADLKRSEALLDPYYLQGHAIGLYAAIINALLLIGAVYVSIFKPWKNINK
jgi:hypothetical protein